MSPLFLLMFMETLSPAWDTQSGIASVYWPQDGHSGAIKADGSRFKKADRHIAHRFLPLGMTVAVENLQTGQWTYARVRDRGTFGFCVHRRLRKPRCPQYPPPLLRGEPCPEGYRWVVRARLRPRECGYYRGVADLTLPVARDIGAIGLTQVRIWYPNESAWSWLDRRLPRVDTPQVGPVADAFLHHQLLWSRLGRPLERLVNLTKRAVDGLLDRLLVPEAPERFVAEREHPSLSRRRPAEV